MKPLYFILALHDHQPVGNFDFVFKEAYDRSYKPFLDVFEKTSSIKICLHTSGPLLDWMEKNEPKYLDRLARLVKAGRIEIMSGGYYEPLLSLIREDDAVGQNPSGVFEFGTRHVRTQRGGGSQVALGTSRGRETDDGRCVQDH